MSATQRGDFSAAFWLMFLSMTLVVGALIITTLNQFWDELESSMLFNFGTKWGMSLARRFTEMHRWLGLVLLVAILYTAFIRTRDPV